MQALQQPPTVDVLPVPANLPGRQEISKKFTECMQALIMAARNKQITLAAVQCTSIRQAKGMHSTADMAKMIAEPEASLLNKGFLCIRRTKKTLIIEKTGRATDTRIDSSEFLPNASLYSVGSQDSIPSRIKPMAIMQTKMGKIPVCTKVCHTLLSDFTASLSTGAAGALSFFPKTRLIATRKKTPTTKEKTVEVKNTALYDIKDMQIGAYMYKTMVETCAPQVTIKLAVTYFSWLKLSARIRTIGGHKRAWAKPFTAQMGIIKYWFGAIGNKRLQRAETIRPENIKYLGEILSPKYPLTS